VYTETAPTEKVVSQIRAGDMSRCYLGAHSDEIPKASKKKRQAWVQNGLHNTVSVRILITLSSYPKEAYKNTLWYLNRLGEDPKETPGKGVKVKEGEKEEEVMEDTIVKLDMSNLHTLIGFNKEFGGPIRRLLAVATGTRIEDWPKN
jgi:hypothetical protein